MVELDLSVDAGVTAVYAAFPGDSWRQSALRDVVQTVVGAAAPTERSSMAGMEWVQSPDAMVWAEKFVEHVARNPSIATDEGTMVGWFANAMQAAVDDYRWSHQDSAT